MLGANEARSRTCHTAGILLTAHLNPHRSLGLKGKSLRSKLMGKKTRHYRGGSLSRLLNPLPESSAVPGKSLVSDISDRNVKVLRQRICVQMLVSCSVRRACLWWHEHSTGRVLADYLNALSTDERSQMHSATDEHSAVMDINCQFNASVQCS